MNYIFNVITRPKLKERENQSYLDFHDFEMALMYLGIFARFADRNRKILQNDIDNTNGTTIDYFLKFMGLELPFNKNDLEQYINDRRSMTVKELLNLQQELRKNDVVEFKKKEMEIEEKKKKEMRRKRLEMEKKKKEMEKAEEEKKGENNENNAGGGSVIKNEDKNSNNKSINEKKSDKNIKKEETKSGNEKKESNKKKK